MEVFQAALNADPLQLLIVTGLSLLVAGVLGSVKDWFILTGQRGVVAVIVGGVLVFFGFVDPRILFDGSNEPPAEEITIENIIFCDRPCSQTNAKEVTLFPEFTDEVFVAFDYSGLQPGMVYTRVWTHQDHKEEWIYYNCVWQGPNSGTFYFSLYERQIEGLHSGKWTITITANNQVTAQGSITIAGAYQGWLPAGVSICPDF